MGLATGCCTWPCVEGGRAQAQNEIKAVIDGMWGAVIAQDEAAFRKVCAPDWKFYTARANQFDTRKLFEIHREGVRDFKITRTKLEIHPGGELAWATYEAEMSCLDYGKPWGGHFIVTSVFEREDGRWRCAQLHESKKPD